MRYLILLFLPILAGCTSSRTLVVDRDSRPVPDAVMQIMYPSFSTKYRANRDGVISYDKRHRSPVLHVRIYSRAKDRAAWFSFPPPDLVDLDRHGGPGLNWTPVQFQLQADQRVQKEGMPNAFSLPRDLETHDLTRPFDGTLPSEIGSARLPGAEKTPVSKQQREVELRIGEQGEIVLNGVPCTERDLPARLKTLYLSEATLLLRSHPDSSYHQTVRVLEILKQAGISKVTFTSDQEE